MKQLRFAWLLCAGVFSAPVLAQGAADDYPSKPVTINVPFDAGASHDTMLRPYVQSILQSSGKQFVLSFRPGAGTTIGTAYVAKAAPDGYNILSVSPAIAITPSVYADLPYDPARDLAPIVLLSRQAFLLVVNAAAPYKTVQEYMAYARANPGALNWGTSGAGSATHLPGEFLHSLTKTQVTYIHYKTGAQRIVDLLAGRVQVTMSSFSNATPHIKSGKMRALAVTTNRRVPDAPDMPTIEEEGVPGYDFSSWLGILAPARTPPAVISRLNTLFNNANKDPLVKKTEFDGNVLAGGTPEQLRQLMATETERWRKLIKETGMKLD